MKNSILTIAILITGLCLSPIIMTSCGNKKAEQQEQKEGDDHQHTEGMDMDSTKNATMEMVYACPMHPEITGKEGDKCSKCGMKLEPVKKDDDKEKN